MNFGMSSYSMPASGAPATLTGAPAANYTPAYGGVPGVPNPASTQGAAIGGNQINLPQLISLLSGVNTSQQNQLLNNYGMAIPNYSGLTSAASTDVVNNLHGTLSPDVISQLTQQAAERGITTGSPGSPNSNAAYLRALGLTSLDLEDKGLGQLATMTQTAPVAPLVNPASFLVTPEQQQEAQMAANLYKSAPNPAAAATKAISLAGGAEPTGNAPWWARSAGMPMALGPGSYVQNGVWHTPA